MATSEASILLGTTWGIKATTGTGHVAAQIAGESGHPGILRLTTGVTDNSRIELYGAGVGWQASAASIGNTYLAAEITSFVWIVRVPSLANVNFRLMLSSAPSLANNIGFFLDTDISGNLNYGNGAASVGTGSSGTTTPPTANTWAKYEVRMTPTSIEYLLNNVSLNTYTANIPTVPLTPNVYIQMRDNVATTKSIDLDLFWLKGTAARFLV